MLPGIGGIGIGMDSMDGKAKVKKTSKGKYIIVFIFVLLWIFAVIHTGYLLLFGNPLEKLNDFIMGIGLAVSTTYLLMISPYTQNPKNFCIKLKEENSVERNTSIL